MTVLDQVRIARAVLGYDFWLEARGVPRRMRRDLRRELRANLREAAADVGTRAALRGLGSTRRLAALAVSDGVRRPLWTLGAATAAATIVLVVWAGLLVAGGFADGVAATGIDGPVEGGLTFVPGARASASYSDGEVQSFGVTLTWPVLVLPAMVFVLASRPWRALPKRTVAV